MKTRQSNMELLRIVSMLMVLAVHLDGASLRLPEPMGEISAMTARDWWRLIVESISIIGVNCFVLISGYFGINARWRSFVNLSATCLFYAVGIYLAMYSFGNIEWSWKSFGESFLIYTHTDLWFIPAYLGLFILSPLLNAAIENLSQKRFSTCLLAFTIFTLYAGWGWGGRFNPSGYTIFQLILLYLIGRYIRLYFPKDKLSGKTCFLIYCLFISLILAQSLWCSLIWTFAYNSPFVLGASIAFFLMFRSLHFYSEQTNLMAVSALSVYLIHKNPIIWILLKNWTLSMWNDLTLTQFSFVFIFAIIAIYVFCITIDRIRILLTSKL